MSAARTATVRSAALRADFDVQHGGRMVSLLDVSNEHEWLVPPSATAPEPTYGSSFTQRHIHGWDEMLPTIDACTVLGVELPDHGEIWAVPWQRRTASTTGGLRLSAGSLALPLRLVREVHPRGPDLVLDYQLFNLGAQPLPFLWAAHPQFRVSPDAQIHFSAPVTKVAVVSPPERVGGTDWSGAVALAGQLPRGDHLKLWLDCPPDHDNGVTLRDGGSALSIHWDGRSIRHAAVLWDNAQFSGERVVAIEPSTARHDSLAAAAAQGDLAMLAGGGSRRWTLTLSVPRPAGPGPTAVR